MKTIFTIAVCLLLVPLSYAREGDMQLNGRFKLALVELTEAYRGDLSAALKRDCNKVVIDRISNKQVKYETVPLKERDDYLKWYQLPSPEGGLAKVVQSKELDIVESKLVLQSFSTGLIKRVTGAEHLVVGISHSVRFYQGDRLIYETSYSILGDTLLVNYPCMLKNVWPNVHLGDATRKILLKHLPVKFDELDGIKKALNKDVVQKVIDRFEGKVK